MSKQTRALFALFLTTTVMLSSAGTVADDSWFVSLSGHLVAPTQRDDVTQLYDAGVIQTDGFRDMVISFGGEFKEGLPPDGRVGAILIPDHEISEYLLRNEGVFVFPTEIEYRVSGSTQGNFFMSESKQTKVAFPRYRVFLYNETRSAASMSVFVYRSR
jgi:hypothetical protein